MPLFLPSALPRGRTRFQSAVVRKHARKLSAEDTRSYRHERQKLTMGSFASKLKSKTEKKPAAATPAPATPAKAEKMSTPAFSHFAGAQYEFKVHPPPICHLIALLCLPRACGPQIPSYEEYGQLTRCFPATSHRKRERLPR